eukprot:m.331360 g.331360  ORF g.331360 m.331360 type:complete len:398 (+) comp20474_c0_seq3:237-1430(+)
MYSYLCAVVWQCLLVLVEANAPGGGSFTIHPPYTTDPALTRRGNPTGKIFTFTLPMNHSDYFNGTDPTFEGAGCLGPNPGECCWKPGYPHCKININRKIFVYIPVQYIDGLETRVLVMQDGPAQLNLVATAMDNLIRSSAHDTYPPERELGNRSLPVFVAIAIENGGSDAIKSERGLEYDTLSSRYAEFVDSEVLPFVHRRLSTHYPEMKLSTNPDMRATFGCSSGGAAALTMAWLRPDLFRRVVAYSGTFVDQQDHGDRTGARAIYPFGAWEYHSSTQLLLTTKPRKPLRVFTHNSEFDLGYYTVAAPLTERTNMSIDNIAGDRTKNWTDGHHNWKVAGLRTASALDRAGYTYRHVYSLDTHHCDPLVLNQTLADTLVWIWQEESQHMNDSHTPIP